MVRKKERKKDDLAGDRRLGLLMPRAGIKGSDRLLSKVELFPRRNSVVFLASDCFSRVEFFIRRNITVLLSGWPSSSFFSVVGEGVTEV